MLAEAIGKKGWESVLATNLTGGFLVSREVYGQFMKSCGGAIVNMLANVWMVCRRWPTPERRARE
jgi:citronellol/citronellal dehydrogenase